MLWIMSIGIRMILLARKRLRELASDKTIGSVADFHYSFMGALPPKALEPRGRALAGLLKQDKVDAVILTPV